MPVMLDAYLGTRAALPAADRQARAGFVRLSRADPPSYGTQNRWGQTDDYKGAVYLAIQAVVDAMSGATVEVVRRAKSSSTKLDPAGDDRFLPVPGTHPLAKLFAVPNERDTTADLIADAVIQDGIYGEHILWGVPNRAGVPVELFTIPRALTTFITPGSQGYPDGGWRVYNAYPGGTVIGFPGMATAGATVPRAEASWFKRRHHLWRNEGMSPLTAGRFMVDLLECIDESRWGAFNSNESVPGVVVTVPGADEDRCEKAEERINARKGGAAGHRKTWVVGSAPGEDPPGVTIPVPNLKQMDYGESWDQTAAFVFALLGVPKELVFEGVANFATLYAKMQHWRTMRLLPFARRLGERWTRDFAWRHYGEEYAVRVTVPDLDDREFKETQAKNAAGILSVNARLKRIDQPAVEFGELPEPLWLKAVEKKAGLAAPPPVVPGGQPGGPPDPAAPPAPAPADAPTPPEPPRPDNPDGAGSLAPRLKAVSPRRAVRLVDDVFAAARAKWL